MIRGKNPSLHSFASLWLDQSTHMCLTQVNCALHTLLIIASYLLWRTKKIIHATIQVLRRLQT